MMDENTISQPEQTATSESAATPARSSADSTPDQGNGAGFQKAWLLLLLPVVGFCGLAICFMAGAALFFWPLRQEQQPFPPVEAGIAVEEVQESAAVGQPGETGAGENAAESPPVAGSSPVSPPAAGASDIQPVVPLDLPAICSAPGLAEPAAVDRPLISPISFATRQDEAGWPLDASGQFTTTIDQLQASFGYAGMENGMTWERVWYFWDDEILRAGGVWDAGERGHLTVYSRVAEQGFVPGRYRLELYVEEQLLSAGSFTLVSTSTVTTRPVQVAYSVWDGDRHRLNLLELDSGQTEPLADFARYPAWSPDTVGLLFLGEDGFTEGPPGLWVFNMNQKKAYPLNEETGIESLAWSPQRTYVAKTLDDGSGPQLELWHLNRDEVIPGPAGQEPAWSPEGRRLAYRGCTAEGWTISTVEVISNVIDFDSTRILAEGDVSQPAWSPDGQRLAFVRQEGDNQDIYTVAADGSDLRRLTESAGSETAPAWTPEGEIIFWTYRDEAWALYAMAADGADQRQLLVTPAAPAWQPERPAVSANVRLVEPTPPAPPKPEVYVPPGTGILVVSNARNNDEMTFTIDNVEHKVPPYRFKTIPLRPNRYTWTASWPGKTSRTGIADIALGQVAYPVIER